MQPASQILIGRFLVNLQRASEPASNSRSNADLSGMHFAISPEMIGNIGGSLHWAKEDIVQEIISTPQRDPSSAEVGDFRRDVD